MRYKNEHYTENINPSQMAVWVLGKDNQVLFLLKGIYVKIITCTHWINTEESEEKFHQQNIGIPLIKDQTFWWVQQWRVFLQNDKYFNSWSVHNNDNTTHTTPPTFT